MLRCDHVIVMGLTLLGTELGGIAITVECSPTDKGPAVEMKPFFGVEYVVRDPKTVSLVYVNCN